MSPALRMPNLGKLRRDAKPVEVAGPADLDDGTESTGPKDASAETGATPTEPAEPAEPTATEAPEPAEPTATEAPEPAELAAAEPSTPGPAAAQPISSRPIELALVAEAGAPVEPSEPGQPAIPAAVADDFAPELPTGTTENEAGFANPSEPEPEIGPEPPSIPESLAKLAEFGRAVVSWIADDGYPVNVDVEIEVALEKGIVRFSEPPGFKVVPKSTIAITGSHIRRLPSGGFDERSHVTVWGTAAARPRGRFAVTADRAWAWDERDMPLPAAYERTLPKARRYFRALSAARGVTVRPRLSPALLLFRATRAPFLSATFAPVLLGLAVAARAGVFDFATALITVVAASAVHLGLNVANDVFDTLQGADDANATPTKFSGGSRVLQNALVSMREMSVLAAGCYAVAAVLGLVLLAMRGSPALVAIVVIGSFISLAYTMPPFKLVYRGVGEIATAIGFGPVMLLGAYTVQSRGTVTLEAFVLSIPVALLVAMILYVNEIPDRTGDAKVGKLTLPVRWPKPWVIRGFDVAAGAAFAVVAVGVAAGILPIPTLLALLAIPLAVRVHAGLVRFYENPYALMATMAANIQLHLNMSMLLLVGYLFALLDQMLLGRTPFLW
jgi:1,4-dihydroxy-2-naphthoate polyprenyltransferase